VPDDPADYLVSVDNWNEGFGAVLLVALEWQKSAIGGQSLQTILYTNDWSLLNDSEDLHRSPWTSPVVYVMSQCHWKISSYKMKTMAFCLQNHIQCKLVVNSYIIQQISRCNVSYWCQDDISIKYGVSETTVEPSKEHSNWTH
jgi:hypothetical protein